jgi:hypothetical protein
MRFGAEMRDRVSLRGGNGDGLELRATCMNAGSAANRCDVSARIAPAKCMAKKRAGTNALALVTNSQPGKALSLPSAFVVHSLASLEGLAGPLGGLQFCQGHQHGLGHDIVHKLARSSTKLNSEPLCDVVLVHPASPRIELTVCTVNDCHGEGFRDPIDILLPP